MFETVIRTIETRLNDNWISTDIAFDNVDYKPVIGTAFVRLTVTQTEANLISGVADTGNYREHGLITIQVFTPINEGVQVNAKRADDIAAIYRGVSIGRLYIGAPKIERLGETEQWFQHNILIPFHYDNCLAL